MDRKDATAARPTWTRPTPSPRGMGLDAAAVVEMRAVVNGPGPAAGRTGAKGDDAPARSSAPAASRCRTRRPTPVTPPAKPEDLPTAGHPQRPQAADEVDGRPAGPTDASAADHPPAATEDDDGGCRAAGDKKEDEPTPVIRTGRPPRSGRDRRTSSAEEVPTGQAPKITSRTSGDMPPLPPVPDVDKLTESTKPPVGPAPVVKTDAGAIRRTRGWSCSRSPGPS